MSLQTPTIIRVLQRKLYREAKDELTLRDHGTRERSVGGEDSPVLRSETHRDLFDHLVSANKQPVRHVDCKCLRGAEIDD
jgi:hypothetical protein